MKKIKITIPAANGGIDGCGGPGKIKILHSLLGQSPSIKKLLIGVWWGLSPNMLLSRNF
ncbi:MAG: hypothetical protein HY602_02970 [Parcubacteria group bacterium]|nr:hypothetical protein [Parcubacteria group bacterium]